MAMMDRVIGRKGCSFSALIALKLFGGKRKNSFKKDMDFEDALDDMLTEELEEDDLKNHYGNSNGDSDNQGLLINS